MRINAKVKPAQPSHIAEQLIYTVIFSRLDCYNSLFTHLNNTAVARLQLAQNTAARHLTNTQHQDHTTPVLANYTSNPLEKSIEKCTDFFKTLNSLAPIYISKLLTPYSTKSY